MPDLPAAPHAPLSHDVPAAAPGAPPGGAVIGCVRSIALRPGAREEPRAMQAALAEAGIGLAGDAHADPLSPRQVLLAGTPAYARHGLAPHTLRENLLLDADTSHFTSGALLRVGPQALLRLTFACEACGYLDAHAPGLSARIGRERGMLARVVRGGAIAVDDPVTALPVEPGADGPHWSDDWRERVAAVLARVPPGMVVEYRQLARLAGVQAVYCRAFPALARRLGFGHAAVSMAGQPDRPRWQGHGVSGMPAVDAMDTGGT
jgi:hypothetical protein